jgi:hypothetical protein
MLWFWRLERKYTTAMRNKSEILALPLPSRHSRVRVSLSLLSEKMVSQGGYWNKKAIYEIHEQIQIGSYDLIYSR